MKKLLAVVGIVLCATAGLRADDPQPWPQFRGPGGSGIADGQTPPVEFGPETNVLWKIAAPAGQSSPIVAGELVVITAFEGEKLYTIAYNRANGNEAWRAEAPARQLEKFHQLEGSPANSTPVTDGERIVSYFGSCGLACYDLSGAELWTYEMPPVSIAGDFGSGVSPILADGLVVIVRDESNDPKIVALDIATGEVRWERTRRSLVSYASPVVWDSPAGKQVVAPGHAQMVGYDLATGEERWNVTCVPSGCCASPIAVDGTLYFAGWAPGGPDDPENQMPKFDDLLTQLDGDGNGSLSRAEAAAAFEGFFDTQDTNGDGVITREEYEAIVKYMLEGKNTAFALRAGGSGDITESHVMWKQNKGLPYVSSAIVYQGQVVMVKDGGIVTAYEAASGAELYQARLPATGKYYASPVAANGNIYFTSLDGEVVVIKGGSTRLEVVAENPSLDERTAATPAVADNTLYIRTAGHLYAFGER